MRMTGDIFEEDEDQDEELEEGDHVVGGVCDESDLEQTLESFKE